MIFGFTGLISGDRAHLMDRGDWNFDGSVKLLLSSLREAVIDITFGTIDET